MPRILVVDDEEKIRDVLVRFLTKEGFEIIQAPGGQEAIEILKSDAKIDLAVLDLKMPKVDGIGVIRKKEELGRRFPVLFLTGSIDAQKNLGELKEKGFTEEDICYKPVDLFALLDMVKKKLQIT